MANEAVLLQQLEDRCFEATIANGTSGTDILKGTVMKFSADPNTVAASSADGDVFAGILVNDKIGGDGTTRCALWRKGVFSLKCAAGGTAVLGNAVKIGGANLIDIGDVTTLTDFGEHCGIALETGGNNEVIQVLVGGSQ